MGAINPEEPDLLAELAALRQRVAELEGLVSDRQEAEQALQEQQRFLQLVLDNIPQQIFWKDTHLVYQGCNRNYAEAVGLESASQIVGQPIEALAPTPELGQFYRQQDLEILRSGVPVLHVLEQKIRADGRLAWLDVSKIPMYDATGKVVGILGTFTDITEQKHAEIALEKSEAQNQALLNAIPDLIIRMHRDGTYLDFRPAKTFTNIQPPGGAAGKSIYEILPYEVAKQRLDYAERALQTQLPQRYEFQIEIDGEPHTEEARIVACGEDEVVVILRDVTEQARSETMLLQLNEALEERVNERTAELNQVNAQLRQSEAGLKVAQELAHVGNWEFDLVAQTITWSEEVFHIHGLDSTQPPPAYPELQRLYHPDDRAQLTRLVDRAIALGEPYEIDMRIIRPSGEIRNIAAKGKVSRNASGEITHLFGTMLDITDRKQTEERLKASLDEKNVLLKEVHHRVKNNLQTISSLLKLQAAALSDPRLREPLRDSQNRVRAMAMVHERLYQSVSLARVDFAEYIHKLATELVRSYGGQERSLTLAVNVAAGELDVDTAIPCGLIVNELVANAVKYAFPDQRAGTIQLTFRRHDATHYCLVVSDNGVGLPAGFNIHESASLGLKLVCLLTQQLEGQIDLEPGPGTTFRLTFPG